ncbi:MAG: hypothetical protein KAI47_20650, partial [Deltaproteobacteria bacterium]|nr:hypothetical protein [Deltaproteobacteria bacterium]
MRERLPPDQRFGIPEQDLRRDVFAAREHRRSPALGALAVQLDAWWFRSLTEVPVTALFGASGWVPGASLGLALAEELGVTPLPSEPGPAWRAIGRLLRLRMQRGAPAAKGLGRLPEDPAATGILGLWYRTQRDHQRRSWMHPPRVLRVQDLLRHPRLWDSEALEKLAGGERPGMRKLRDLPAVKVALARRSRERVPQDEEQLLFSLAAQLGCEARWDSVVTAATGASWQRQRRIKPGGGLRWLDVPPPHVRDALHVVGKLLASVSPRDGVTTAFHPGARPALHALAHAGANAALRADIRNFFGQVRPEHLKPWLGLGSSPDPNVLPEWSSTGREALLSLLFFQRRGRPPYLPQGSPSSPVAANLAGTWLDRAVIRRASVVFGPGHFSYSRYADDLALSVRTSGDVPGFFDVALKILRESAEGQGWRL